jgi:hypothetical protein
MLEPECNNSTVPLSESAKTTFERHRIYAQLTNPARRFRKGQRSALSGSM